ncbi:MAG: SRPBCC family protein [Solirubrobacterales bacterium]|nr:SRPBCC family protein [Solirubrobacterales bacterium]MCO5328251.1 SRPBCC family protein [Solirubrobacterales bacterium]
MRINTSMVVKASREDVWDLISDPGAYAEFMSGFTRWELDGDDATDADRRMRLGSRIRMLIQVGSAQVGGLIEIVECKTGSDMAWSSVTGVDQRGRWRIRDSGEGKVRVELRFSYGVAGGGIPGVVAERVAKPIVSRRLRSSLLALKKIAERNRLRREGRARRAAAGASTPA